MDGTELIKSAREDEERMNNDELAKIVMEVRNLAQENARLHAANAAEMKATWKRIDENRMAIDIIREVQGDIKVLIMRQDGSDSRTGKLEARVDKVEETFEAQCAKVKAELDEIRMKPARRWDGAVSQIVTLVIAAVVGWLIKHFAG